MTDAKLGEWSPVQQITQEEKKIFFEVKPMIEKMAKREFKIYFPTVYSSQVVAGMNYMVKVLVDVCGDGMCVHAWIFQQLGGELSVKDIQYLSVYDPLVPF
ncbi:stefin-C-like [Labeo rohita]|uniref:stefin-C-like n=1 Tax=Labeo rohita TaxID=84645 RepID=UPI0021E1FAAE|nr:stefin-C-like [Labeo rohita]